MEKELFDMAILQQKLDKTKGEIEAHDYDTTKVKFYLEKIPKVHKIEWHKKNCNMVSRDLIQSILSQEVERNGD
jgi:hypothetical protein